jgi:hypothetical protein
MDAVVKKVCETAAAKRNVEIFACRGKIFSNWYHDHQPISYPDRVGLAFVLLGPE